MPCKVSPKLVPVVRRDMYLGVDLGVGVPAGDVGDRVEQQLGRHRLAGVAAGDRHRGRQLARRRCHRPGSACPARRRVRRCAGRPTRWRAPRRRRRPGTGARAPAGSPPTPPPCRPGCRSGGRGRGGCRWCRRSSRRRGSRRPWASARPAPAGRSTRIGSGPCGAVDLLVGLRGRDQRRVHPLAGQQVRPARDLPGLLDGGVVVGLQRGGGQPVRELGVHGGFCHERPFEVDRSSAAGRVRSIQPPARHFIQAAAGPARLPPGDARCRRI